MAKWTDEQQAVIDSRGKNQLVSAAAGSGKTAVLIERILQLILEGVTSVDRLLVVTFTKAAASEMKERLHGALNAAMDLGGADTERLKKQIRLLPRAQISTIHAFCKEVIQDHFELLGIDPGFKVAAEPTLEKLQDQVMDEVFDAAYIAEDPVFHALLESYTKARSDEPLRSIIKKIYTFSRTHVDPEGYLKKVLQQYDGTDMGFWKQQLGEAICQILLGVEEAYLGAIDQQLASGLTHYTGVFRSDFEGLRALRHQIEKAVDSAASAYGAFSYDRAPALSKKFKETLSEEDVAAYENIKEQRDAFKSYLKKRLEPFCTLPADTQVEALIGMAPRIEYLIALVEAFMVRFDALKADKGMLDFSDLEQLAISLLKRPDVADGYRARFDFVFTDEYQDSNRVQEFILNQVSKVGCRFMVGDIKQSIYKFRLADPTLFIETYHQYDRLPDIHSKHDLNRNFRSAPSVLAFINACFEPVMRASFGGIDYDDRQRLYPGAIFEQQVPPEMILIDRSRTEDDAGDEDIPEVAYAEATAVADRILKLVGKEFHFNPKDQSAKLIAFSDVVVLLRSVGTSAAVYREVFFEKRIPLFTETQTGYFDAVEIGFFMQFLRLIDNETLDLPLMTVLKSPIGNLSLKTLVRIRTDYPSATYYDCVVAAMADPNCEYGDKLRQFFEKLKKYKAFTKQMALDDLIWRLLLETNYYDSIGLHYQGEAKQANLRLLVKRAQEYMATERTSLHGFLKYIDELSKKEVDYSEARLIHEKDDVVKLMTIHKSKGLEFPVVFIGGLGKRFNEQDLREPIVLHSTVGLSTAIIDVEKRTRQSSLPEQLVKYNLRKEMLEEELRILYVAMTRAIHRLILVGSSRDLDKAFDKWQRPISGFSLHSAGTALDFIQQALCAGRLHPDDIERLKMENRLEKQAPLSFVVQIHRLKEVVATQRQQPPAIALVDLKQQIEAAHFEGYEAFKLPYPHGESIHRPVKISVTEYKKMRHAKTPEPLVVPELLHWPIEAGQGGMVRGTQIHSILEHMPLPYAHFETAFKKTKDWLLEKGLLTEEVLKTIKPDDIQGFYDSDIGIRLLNAQRYHREQPFVLKLEAKELYEGDLEESVLLQGIIDLYFEEPDGLVLIDYKSDQLTTEQLPQWRDRYAMTLDLYQRALEDLTGKSVKERYIYSTFNRDFITV